MNKVIRRIETLNLISKNTVSNNYVKARNGKSIILAGNYHDTLGAEVHLLEACDIHKATTEAGETVVMVTTYSHYNKPGNTGRLHLFCAEEEEYSHSFLTKHGTNRVSLCLQTDDHFASEPNTLRRQSMVCRVKSYLELKEFLVNYKK